MIDLSKNTNPYFPNKKMLKYLKRNISIIKNYSDKHVRNFNNDFLKKYGINNKNILITNGTMDAMDLILKTYRYKTIGLFDPTFWGIKELAKINNNKIVQRKLSLSSEYNIDEIEKIASKSDILYLCNCNNPTLNYVERESLLSIIKKYSNCLFIIDETVLIFDNQYDQKTLIKYVNELNNLVVLVSLSKIFGVCGLRLGILVTSDSERDKYMRKQVPYSNSSLSILFLNKYLEKISSLEKIKNKINKNFTYLIKKIDYENIDNIIYNSSSFLLIKLKDDVDYEKIYNHFLENNIKVSAINHYYKNLTGNYLRIGAGKKSDYKKLIKVLKKYNKV